MAKQLLASLLITVAFAGLQGCGKSQKTVADDKAIDGTGKEQNLNTIDQQLQGYQIYIQRSSVYDASVEQQTRATASLLTNDQLIKVRALLTQYIADVSRLLEIASTDDVSYNENPYTLARYQVNAQTALDQINTEIGSRTN